jgi:2-(1,2-epoxy-1,2-dihydrophenyl)acetyl-CoA isomerase
VVFAVLAWTLGRTKLGLLIRPGDGGTWYLPHIVGVGRTLELCWTGDIVGAIEAEQIGLINFTARQGQLLDAARALARAIAAKPLEAIRAYKRSFYPGLTMPRAAHLGMASSHMSILRETPEHRELVESFLARKAGRDSAADAQAVNQQ